METTKGLRLNFSGFRVQSFRVQGLIWLDLATTRHGVPRRISKVYD